MMTLNPFSCPRSTQGIMLASDDTKTARSEAPSQARERRSVTMAVSTPFPGLQTRGFEHEGQVSKSLRHSRQWSFASLSLRSLVKTRKLA